MAAKIWNNGANATQVFDEWTPVLTIEWGRVQEDHRLARSCIAKTQLGAVRFIPTIHILGGYAVGSPIGSSGIPIQQARYATATIPPEKKNPTTVTMRTRATSHPYACARLMHTPAIALPWCGRINGLPGMGGATEITAPQFEQN